MSTTTIILPPETPRSPMLVALSKRHGSGVKTHKDRRLARGGSKNKQAAYRNGDY